MTWLAFALIPLSGFSLDIFIPSLPSMASDLHTNPAAIQLTLSLFLISLGVCQLFIGSILDSFGRYLPTLTALLLFSVASFAIAYTDSLPLIYAMRSLQGACIATIVVSKRAVLIDLYSGEQLKAFMSLLSVVWSAAPIVAPFIGGFLQVQFGWRSNFVCLGLLGTVFLLLELFVDGETIRARHPFDLKTITGAYLTMVKASDFSLGLIILGFCYTMLMVYGMVSPFIIEHLLHLSPTVTGNASLTSGVVFLLGGILSRKLINRPFYSKMLVSMLMMEAAALTILGIVSIRPGWFTLLAFVITMHLGIGFVFNSVFSFVLTRFAKFGGKASGLAGGVYIILTSALSQSIVSGFHLNAQVGLGWVYVTLTLIILSIFAMTRWGVENKKL